MCNNDARGSVGVGLWGDCEEGVGEGWVLSLMTFLNSEKLSNFKVHKLSGTVNKLSSCRSSHQRFPIKKVLLEISENSQSLFFNKGGRKFQNL